jgi:hypothetical protein
MTGQLHRPNERQKVEDDDGRIMGGRGNRAHIQNGNEAGENKFAWLGL